MTEHERDEQHDRAAQRGFEEYRRNALQPLDQAPDPGERSHQRPSVLAASIRRDIRSSSASLIFSPLIASSAATACSAELSKKVRSRWLRALWRAASRRTRGMYT